MKKEDISTKDKKQEKNKKASKTKDNKEVLNDKATNEDSSIENMYEEEKSKESKIQEVENEDVKNGNKKEISKEEELENEIKAQKDKYLRLFAEFENYKRRTSKERLELFKTASQDLMQVMLPVLDDFDRALKEISKSDDKSLIEGVELISNKLRETLKSKGLEPMAVNPGDTFDADIHEAVTQIPAPEDSMKGKIVDVVEKGYTLGDKIIRFPKVVTGK